MRLDKYLSMVGIASRSTIANRCKAGYIFVNNKEIIKSDTKIKEGDIIEIDYEMIGGEGAEEGRDNLRFEMKEHVTIVLYKPQGYVCSDVQDGGHPSYRELLSDCPYAEMLHVAGRLDWDTTGLVIATSDGDLNHRIISPKHKLIKTYIVGCARQVSDTMRQQLEKGVALEDGYETLPAKVLDYDPKNSLVDMPNGYNIVLQICEGKFHQVKRMLQAVDNEVIRLHRASVGDWNLEGMKEGEWKYI